jgi:hypothetical protein
MAVSYASLPSWLPLIFTYTERGRRESPDLPRLGGECVESDRFEEPDLIRFSDPEDAGVEPGLSILRGSLEMAFVTIRVVLTEEEPPRLTVTGLAIMTVGGSLRSFASLSFFFVSSRHFDFKALYFLFNT